MENVFDNLISLKEVADIWYLEESTIKKAIKKLKYLKLEAIIYD